MNRRDFAKSLIVPGVGLALGVSLTPLSTPEGEDQPEDTVVATISTHGKTFALGFKLDKDILEDDRYSVEWITKMTNALASAARNTIGQEHHLPPWRVGYGLRGPLG